MDENKKKAIQQIMDSNIKSFAEGFELRYSSEVDDPEGVINRKKNNCFIAELGKEFMFYSAFVRSFDSSFGRILENIGNSIAKLSYDVRGNIESFYFLNNHNIWITLSWNMKNMLNQKHQIITPLVV